MYYMVYASVVTSKGTITLPAPLRRQLGLSEGVQVSIEQGANGELIVQPMPSLAELRRRNRQHLESVGLWPPAPVANDAGLEMYVREKYGGK